MNPASTVAAKSWAWRYVAAAAWVLIWFAVAFETRRIGLNDWLLFEFGARTLIHFNQHYASGSLGVYAHYPSLQIGPPSFIVVAGVQWLPPKVAEVGMAALMSLAGVWCVRCIETTMVALVDDDRRGAVVRRLAIAAVVALPFWAWQATRAQHLDDVLAITFTMTAVAAVATRRPWWLTGVLVGMAIASKPWAIVIAPLVFALPRQDRARAALVAMLLTGGCWAPFVIGDPQTIHALSNFRFDVYPDSAVHALGVPLGFAPRWIRPVQFVGGFLLSAAAVKRGRWLAIPLIGFAFRVAIDPQTWMYYGMGPLLGAVLWDTQSSRRWPVWTALTVIVEFAIPPAAPSWAGPVRLLWFIVVAAAVLRPMSREPHRIGSRPNLGVFAPWLRPTT